jgi:hypothetical protein
VSVAVHPQTTGLDELARARQADPLDPELANQEHAAFARLLVERYGPLGMLAVAALVPGYQAAKWTAQNVPGGSYLDAASTRLLGTPLASPTTTPPSWEQLAAGLGPILHTFKPGATFPGQRPILRAGHAR